MSRLPPPRFTAVVGATNRALNVQTVPSVPKVTKDFAALVTTYGAEKTMTVLDQFDHKLDSAYNGVAAVTETKDQVAINQTISNATYGDWVGFLLNDPGGAPVVPLGGPVAFAWILDRIMVAPGLTRWPLQGQLVSNPDVLIQVGGHQLIVLHRQKTLTPTMNNQLMGDLIVVDDGRTQRP
jgi:hypothetical protein